jgi:branched-chain amino acid transport system permease protein
MLLASIYVGTLYGIVAVGYTILFRAGGVLNFAQGGLLVVAAFLLSTFLAENFGIVVGAALATLIVTLMSVGIYNIFLRRLTGLAAFGLTILTMGISIAGSAIVEIVWGLNVRTVVILKNDPSINLLGIGRLSLVQIISIGCCLAFFCLLMLFFRYTRVGLQLRAASENPALASRSGLSVGHLYSVAWMLAGITAGVGGILLGAALSVSSSLSDVGLIAFPAAIVGGFGSIPGALIGGLIIGLVEQATSFYINPTLGDVLVYVVLMLVLLVRPWGLFGRAELTRS